MQQDRGVAVSHVHEELVQLVRELMTGERPVGAMPTFAQHAVLSYISRNPGCRATDVSDAFGVHRSTVSRQLRGCVDSAWIHVEPGPVRQGRPLTLTAAGVGVLDQADQERRTQVQARLENWATDDIAAFAHLLHHFCSQTQPIRTSTETPGDDHSA